MGFGLFAGLSYPFFMPLFGVDSASVMTPLFWASSVFAGVSMGVINFLWVHFTVRPHLRLLADRMHSIELVLSKNMYQEDWNSACGHQSCFIEAASDDEIGMSAHAFNALVKSLVHAHDVEFALKELGQTLSSSLELGQMGEAALRLMIARTSSSAGCLFVEDKGRLTVIANLGIQNAEKLAKDPFVLYCMDLGRKDIIALPEDVEVNALLTQFRPKEVLIVPIRYKDENQGVLVLATAVGYHQEDHELVDMFIQGLGLAMSNALTHDRLQDLAAMDPLTAIYNRRFGLNKLREEFLRAQRGQLPLSVVMIDLDHFKQINDTYGHLMGDRVLVEITEVVRNTLRDEDVLIRYGGEELLLVLPGADLKMGASIADRIRRLIEDMVIIGEHQKLKVTASMGVSAVPRAFTENELQLIKAADDALYQAKAAGRNRVLSTR
jgi:diguanylate cyclase (GGDEF)-like protein